MIVLCSVLAASGHYIWNGQQVLSAESAPSEESTGSPQTLLVDYEELAKYTDTQPEDTIPVISVPFQELSKPDYSFPLETKAFYLEPGKDILKNESATEEEVAAEIDTILQNLAAFDFTTIILDTRYNGKVVYDSELFQSTDVDVLSLLIEKAEAQNAEVYVVHHLYGNTRSDGSTTEAIMSLENHDFLLEAVQELANRYSPDGILMADYETQPTAANYYWYTQTGLGMDYMDWLKENADNTMRDVTRQVLYSDATVAVGLLTESVWANQTTREEGSATAASYESLVDGMADTRAWVQDGYFDFVLAKAYGSLTDGAVPFVNVVEWWSNLCNEAGIPFFAMQSAENAVSSQTGWSGPDQLARQIARAREIAGYRGSAFYGYGRLIADPSGSTRSVIQYYADNYPENELFQDLTISYPSKTQISTYEAEVRIEGRYDPQQEVYINGEKVIPTSRGQFLVRFPLEVGDNTFRIEHKGQVQVYTVHRDVDVLKGMVPYTGTLELDGETRLMVDVVGYRGSSVYAVLNGMRIDLEPVEGGDDENSESIYMTYRGSFVLPEGIIEQEQDLGRIVVYGSYQSESDTITGARVKVKALPPPITVMPTDQIIVTSTYAWLYEYNSTHEYPSPLLYALPEGTIDYIDSELTVDGVKYYKTVSGKRVSSQQVEYFDGEDHGDSGLRDAEIWTEDGATYLRFKVDWKAPFDLTIPGYDSMSGNSYQVENFDAGSIAITFDYTKEQPQLNGSFEGTIFSGAEWQTVSSEINQTRLVLDLADAGSYYGASAYYEDEETLVFRFNQSPGGLDGVVIYVDAGHGGYQGGRVAAGETKQPSDYADAGAIGTYLGDDGATVIVAEAELNWEMAMEVASMLEMKGATVILPDADANHFELYERPFTARGYYPHIFLSIHHNSAPGTAGTGVEVFYNTPFSQPLAETIVNEMSDYYDAMYADGKNRNRGDKWSEFAVTREKQFVSVLVEVGFVNNPEELKLLHNSLNRYGMAQAIVDGIEEYVTSH